MTSDRRSSVGLPAERANMTDAAELERLAEWLEAGIPFVTVEEAADLRAAAKAIRERADLSRRLAEAEGALRWYAEQVAGCRKITSEGNAARAALDRDGGKRARAALNPEPHHAD